MPKRRSTYLVFLCLVVLISVRVGDASENDTDEPAKASYTLLSSVMGSAGSPGSSGGFRSIGTLGQPTPIGIGAVGGKVHSAGFWYIWSPTPTGATSPKMFTNELLQNFPNPFNPSTTIKYSVAGASVVQITIYNVRGERVRTLVNEKKHAGVHKTTWNGLNDQGAMVATGVYFYFLRIGSFTAAKKMILLK